MSFLFRALAVLCLLLTGTAAQAQGYPSKPITFVVPFGPGSGSDLIARIVGQRLSTVLGQGVIVENKPGANGAIAAVQVARSAPDGYTIFLASNTPMSAAPSLNKSIAYDPIKDFIALCRIGSFTQLLLVNPGVPVKSIEELIAYAKANPGKLQFGTSGVASPHHLAGELLKLKTGIDIVHVPYRGGALSANDLAGGHVPMAFVSYSAVAGLVPTGKVRILAVVEKTRYAALPDVPTVAETIPGYEMSSWLGFFAPAGTPAPIVTRLHDAIVKILKTDQVKERLATVGLAVVAGTPAELAETVRSGIAVRGDLVKAAKIEPQ